MLESEMAPRDLLEICHNIEAEARRARDTRWEPRTLDIDLLAFGDQILPDLETYNHWRTLPLDEQSAVAPEGLILPHPRLQDRSFVLVPMMDIAPDWEHPVLGLSTQQMLARLPASDIDAVTPLETP
jgi:2-amino-4-hydroxy-6-hydroxymethyldihydropteridine diphosphokinase